MTTARDIMHQGVRCIPATETLDRAAQLMREMNLGALPICAPRDGAGRERMVGMITDRDIVVKWIDAGADIKDALQTMKSHQIRRLPVIDRGQLVGMISAADIARHLPESDVHGFAERVYAPS